MVRCKGQLATSTQHIFTGDLIVAVQTPRSTPITTDRSTPITTDITACLLDCPMDIPFLRCSITCVLVIHCYGTLCKRHSKQLIDRQCIAAYTYLVALQHSMERRTHRIDRLCLQLHCKHALTVRHKQYEEESCCAMCCLLILQLGRSTGSSTNINNIRIC